MVNITKLYFIQVLLGACTIHVDNKEGGGYQNDYNCESFLKCQHGFKGGQLNVFIYLQKGRWSKSPKILSTWFVTLAP